MRTFLGVGKYAPLPGICGDLRWTSALSRQQTTPVRYLNLFHANMPRSRLTRQVFEWDYYRVLSERRPLVPVYQGDIAYKTCAACLPHRYGTTRLVSGISQWNLSRTYRTVATSFDKSVTRVRTLGVATVASFNHVKKVGQRGSRFASSALD